MDNGNIKVAVVGAGPAGLAALKELRSLGFDVTGFERRGEVGGVWSWSDNPSHTSALKVTRICNSKFFIPFSDHPLPPGTSLHPASPEMGAYFRSYATRFDLYPSIQFNKTVTSLQRSTPSSSQRKWLLTFSSGETLPFDKIIWATGGFLEPRRPKIPGVEDLFRGRICHSQDVRELSAFAGQNTVVLGIGNTAGDLAVGLVPYLSEGNKIYLAHRRPARLISRYQHDGSNSSQEKGGKPQQVLLPSDIDFTHGMSSLTWALEWWVPRLYGWMMDSMLAANLTAAFGKKIDESWRRVVEGVPSLTNGWHYIVCSEDLVPLLREGEKVFSVPGIKRIIGEHEVELDDGQVLSGVDNIITATGYSDDNGLLSEALTFTDVSSLEGREQGEKVAPLPDLYMGILPPEDAEDFAMLSNVHVNGPQLPGRELAAMAVAQIFAGKSKLPSKEKMKEWVGKHQPWMKQRIARAPGVHRGEVPSIQWFSFVHEMAGTGLLEYCSFGSWCSWNSWKLWWQDPELYRALGRVPGTPHAYRLFETGKREMWEGARQAVLDVDKEAREMKEAVAARGKEKKTQ